ncbi:putative neuropeptide Y receptor 11 [Bienertia sinuspersici]
MFQLLWLLLRIPHQKSPTMNTTMNVTHLVIPAREHLLTLFSLVEDSSMPPLSVCLSLSLCSVCLPVRMSLH